MRKRQTMHSAPMRPTAPWKQDDELRAAWRWVCVEILPQIWDENCLRSQEPSERNRQWVGWACEMRTFIGKGTGRPARLDFARYANYESIWIRKASQVSWGYCNPDRERYDHQPLAELRRQRAKARHLAQELSQQNPQRQFAAMLERLPQGDTPQTREFNFDQMTPYMAGKRIT